MKRNFFGLSGIAAVLSVLLLSASAFASGGAYIPGSEGALGATLPPPGFYYKMYNYYIQSDEMTDADGHKLDIDFDLNLMIQAHRLAYFMKNKLFGGDFGMNLIIPIVAADLEIGASGITDSQIGVGDVFVEPIIFAAHGDRWDAAIGFGVGFPTGAFDADEPASPGTGRWYGMMTTGGTVYPDSAKTWSISALTRTLTFGEQDDTKITPGEEFVVDVGIAKDLTISEKFLLRPALVGYGYWQVAEDDGPGTTDDKGSNYAVGAELNLFWLPRLTQFNLKYLQDVDAQDEAKSTKVIFSIVHTF